MNTSTKIKSALLTFLCCWVALANAQMATASYTTQVNYVESSSAVCGLDGNGSNQYTANVWTSNNVATTLVAVGCITGDAPNGGAFQYGQHVTMQTFSLTTATTINSQLQAWEEDSGTRCAYENNASFGDGDDCGTTYSGLSYNFRAQSAPSGTFVVGPRWGGPAHFWALETAWSYAASTATLAAPTCSPLTAAYATGNIDSWSVTLAASTVYKFSTSVGTHELRVYSNTDGLTLVASGTGSVQFTSGTAGIYYLEVTNPARAVLTAGGTLTYQAVGSVLGLLNGSAGNTTKDYCSSSCDFTAAGVVTLSGATGVPVWQYRTGDGVWHAWCTGATLNNGSQNACGTSCFGKNTGDGTNADAIRVVSVQNGTCAAVGPSGVVSITNHYNEDPSSLTFSTNNVCPGTAVTLQANFPNAVNRNGVVEFYSGSCGTGTLLGSVQAGVNSSQVTLAINAPASSTNYYARYNPGTGASCSAGACASAGLTVKSLSAQPTSAGATNINICTTGSTSLSVNGGSLGTGAVWKWYAGGCGSGTSIGSGTPLAVSSIGSTTQYFVRAEGDCNTTLCGTAVQVNVSGQPGAPTATKSPVDANVCLGPTPANLSLTLTSPQVGSGGAGTFNYEYNADGAGFSTSVPTITNPSTGAHNIQIRTNSWSGSGCGTSSPTTYSWTVVPDPTVTISGPSSVCSGSTASFTSSITNGVGTPATYQWQSSPDGTNFSDILVGGNSSTYTSGPLTTTTYYKLKITQTGVQCDAITQTASQVTIDPLPNGSFTTSKVTCVGGNDGTITVTPSGGTGPYTYSTDGLIYQSSNVLSGLTVGSYSVWVKDSKTCPKNIGTATITQQDLIPPVISCPSNVSVSSETGHCYSTVSYSTPVGTDNCGVVGVTTTQTSGQGSGSQFAVGTTTNTFQVTDRAGLTSTCSFTVSVTDDELPVLHDCPGDQVGYTPGSTCTANVVFTAPTATDNCSASVTQTAGPTNGFFDPGVTTVTYQATDASGNSSSCSFNVTVTDEIYPVFSNCPGGFDVGNDAGYCTANVSWDALDYHDNCSIASYSQIAGPASGSDFAVGSTEVTFQITDVSGNQTLCDFMVNVYDFEAPTVVCHDMTVNNDPNVCGANLTLTDPTVTDNCGVDQGFTFNDWGGGTFPVGDTYVTWFAFDNSFNLNVCAQLVHVDDVQPPSITCAASQTQSADAGACSTNVTVVSPEFSDNCGDVSGVSISNDITFSTDASGVYNVGDNIVTWTATDATGNTSTCTQTISVTDDEAPQITSCPVSVSLNTDTGKPYGTVDPLEQATATDNCGVATIESDHASPRFAIGTSTVTWTVTDIHGNTSTCTQIVIVNDGEEPFIACADNITVNNDPGQCAHNNVTIGIPYAWDNSGHVTITVDYPGIAMGPYNQVPVTEGGPYPHPTLVVDFPVGTTTLIWTATDPSGNSTSCVQTVTVLDNELPTIACPAGITTNNDAGLCSANLNIGTPAVTDNCGIKSVVSNHPSSTYAVGTTVVTWTVTDLSNNTATCTQTIIVNDNEAPVIVCPYTSIGNQLFRAAKTGFCYATITVPAPVVGDNCGVASVVNDFNGTSNASGDYPVGFTTVVWTVTDIHGNSSSCEDYILVIDNQKPVVHTQNITVYLNANGFVSITTNDIDNGSTDNCGVDHETLSQTLFTCANVGANTVTLTVYDPSGNHTSGTATVTVVDAIHPTALCQDVTLFLNGTGHASVAAAQVSNGSSDNCGIASQVLSKSNFDCSNLGSSNPVTLTVTDVNGNTSTCSSNITVLDIQAPVATCQNITVALDATGHKTITGTDVAGASTDNCSFTLQVNPSSFSCSNVGNPVTVTVIATDGSGNNSFCLSTVTIIDNTPPIISCPADITHTADAGVCSYTVNIGTATATDNCAVSGVSGARSDAASLNAPYPVGTTTVTWTATDVHGNTSTCEQTITVTDDELPTIACAANQTQTADPGVCQAAVSVALPTTGDNCSVSTVTIDHTSNIYPVGTTSVVWTVTDIHGNSSSCSQTITVTDNEAPGIVCSADQTQTADPGVCTTTVTVVSPSTTDNCGVSNLTNSYTGTSDARATYNVGTTIVVWTVTDIHGNSSSCNQNITVRDDEAPSIACAAAQLQTANVGLCTSAVTVVSPVTGDNCGVASVTNSFNSSDNASGTYAVGTTQVVWTVTDIHGNVSTCAQNITVTDDELPSITCAADQIQTADQGLCSAAVAVSAPGTGDNCGVASVTNSFNGSADASGTYGVGTTSVVWTVTDIHGNSSSCTQNITVTDNEAPSITCAADQTQTADAGVCTAAVSVAVLGYTDNCGVASVTNSFNGTDNASGTYGVGTTSVVWTVTDIHGNVSTCAQNITVTDNEAPVIACASNQTQTADAGVCNAVVIVVSPATSDNCGVASVLNSTTNTNNASGTYGVGTTNVVWTVTDIHGNSSSCTQTITVTDNEAPSIACSADQSQTADQGLCSAAVTVVSPVTGDNCGVASVLNSVNGTDNASGIYAVGTTNVVWTVTDIHGNSSSCSHAITVTDDEAPSIACSADQTQTADAGVCTAAVTVVSPATGDNCGVASVSNSVNGTDNASGTYAVGTVTVVWTVTDIHGNSSSCSQNITVTDDELPTIACAANVSVNNDGGNCSAQVSLVSPVTGDNCGVATLSNDHPSDIYPVGSTDVTWTVLDIHGNTSSCVQNVTVTDNELPTIACSADVSVNNDPGVCEAQVTLTEPATGDNCGVASLTNDHTSNVYPVGSTDVTWVVTDIHGNTSSCVQNVTVTDNELPVITCANNVNVSTDASLPYATVSITLRQPSASDNCEIEDVSSDHASPRFPIGTTVVTWTATDIHGNTSSCTQTIQVNDEEAPVILCGGSITVNSLPGECTGDVTLMIPFAHDNSHHFILTVDYGGISLPTYTPTPTTENDPNAPRPTVIANFPVGVTILTWTATDSAGNSSSCTQTITVIDNENPTITCAADVSVNNDGGQCSAEITLAQPATADNCGVSTITNDHPSSTFTVGTTVVTWTVTDIHGNTATCTQTVIVTDSENPTISCSANVSVNSDNAQCSAAITLTPPAVADNCGVDNLVSDHASNIYPVGTTTVLWTVTDIHGNTASCSQTVTVTDNEAPGIVCSADQTQTADAGVCKAAVTVIAPATGDNCGVASVSNSVNSTNNASGTYNVGTTNVVWTVTDIHGNASSCTQTITVTDDESPAISCTANVTVNINVGQCTGTVSLATPSTSDNCGVATVSSDHASSTYGVGTTTVTWTVTDIHGNTASCSQTVTVIDNVKPTIVCPANVTATTNTACTATGVSLGNPVLTDNCGVPVATTNHASTTYPKGVTTVIWTVSDGNGNTATCSQTVTVTDNVKPTISCPANVTVGTNSGCIATGVSIGTPVTADNCSVATVVNNHASTTYPKGVTTVIWTVTDGSGNTASCSQTITVIDNVNPTISCPAGKTVYLSNYDNDDNQWNDGHWHMDNNHNWSDHNHNDNHWSGNHWWHWDNGHWWQHDHVSCSAEVSLGTPVVSDNCGVSTVANNHPGNTFPVGSTGVIWTVTDGSGNTTTCVQTITIIDDVKPHIECPDDVSVTTNSGCTATDVNLDIPVTFDNCTVASVTNNHPSTTYPLGTTVVIWTVTDASGNTATCTQTVRVRDDDKPVISCPADKAVTITSGCTAIGVILGTPVATDNCSVASVTNNHASTTYPLGTTTVRWTVVDGSGNTATCTQTVTVTDNVKPTISCPANKTVYMSDYDGDGDGDGDDVINGINGCSVQVNLGTPVVSDNCGGLTVTNDQTDNIYPKGTTTVIWTVTDASGNTATCSQTVTVIDDVAPQLDCPANKTVSISSGCDATVIIGTATASDNCTLTSLTNNHASTTYPVGVTTVIWTATDASGNVSTCSQTVTVKDIAKPTISCPAAVTATTTSGCNATVSLGTATATDNCTIASIKNNQADNIFPKGVTTVIWTVTDASGNTATCTQTVTVTDIINPTVVCPANVIATTNTGCNATGVNLRTPAAADNCSVAGVTNNQTDNIYPLGVTTVIWTVTDASGNTATCSQTVTVSDNDAPTITCPANKVVNVTSGCTAIVSLGTPVTADNCTVASVVNNHPSTTYPVGTTTVLWTVTDAAGNTATCTQTVTVRDNINPTISCSANVTASTGSSCSATVNLTAPVATDNCSVSGVTNNQSDNVYPTGVTTVIWTVTDGSGNTATCSQTVTVTDNVKPGITCPANKTVTTNANNCNANGVILGSTITADNCSVASVSNNHSGNTYPAGATTVIWTVTDGSGNTATCSQVLTVICNGHLVNPTPETTASSSLMIKAYPNPFSNEVSLKVITLDTKTPISLKIFTSAGEQLENREDISYDSNDIMLGKTLPAGIYLIQVTQGKNIQVERVVKVE